MTRRTIALLCLVTFPLSACHSYRFADTSEAVPGAEIRLRVTPEESGRLQESVIVRNREVEGTVVERSDGGRLMLEAPIPGTNPVLFQRVQVPESEILDVQVREFSTGKTVLLVGAITAAALAVGITATASDKNDPEGGPPPEPDNIRIPLLRFGVR